MKIIENFFSDEDFNFLNEKSLEIYNNKNTSKNTWNYNVKQFSKEIEVYDLKEENTIYSVINKTLIYYNIFNYSPQMRFFYCPPGSYIPWHTDEGWYSALTIYLNDNWNFEFGGLYQYYDDNEIKTIIPRKNLALFQKGGISHSTTIQSVYSPIRRSVQIHFIDSYNSDIYEKKTNKSLI
jgi:hypothetical protein